MAKLFAALGQYQTCMVDTDGICRYETLLTMYGEKAEEVDELRMDLSDVKVIYKAQVSIPNKLFFYSCEAVS